MVCVFVILNMKEESKYAISGNEAPNCICVGGGDESFPAFWIILRTQHNHNPVNTKGPHRSALRIYLRLRLSTASTLLLCIIGFVELAIVQAKPVHSSHFLSIQ